MPTNYATNVTQRLLKQQTKERNELLHIVSICRLPLYYDELLQLNAIRGIDDLELLNDSMIESIISAVNRNEYKGEVDLEDRLMREKYLGHGSNQYRLFTIKQIDRVRLLSLAAAAAKYREEKEARTKQEPVTLKISAPLLKLQKRKNAEPSQAQQ